MLSFGNSEKDVLLEFYQRCIFYTTFLKEGLSMRIALKEELLCAQVSLPGVGTFQVLLLAGVVCKSMSFGKCLGSPSSS